ncbi:armadillo-type protein [Tirmania nivea]|nr:armadillo-type protein [Tirmania nivea]
MDPIAALESARRAAFLQASVSGLVLSSQSSSPPASLNRDLSHSLESLLTHVRHIADSTPHVLNQALGDYIFFPLTHIFRQHQALSDRVVELVLRIVKILAETCWRAGIEKELAKQLMILVTFIVGGTPLPQAGGRQQRLPSEEVKIAGCEVLAGLFRAMVLSPSTRGLLTEEQNLPAVGHLISTLLGVLLQSTESVELGKASLDALTVLIKDLIKDKDVLASFLPGVVSQFTKVLAPQSKMTRRSQYILSSSLDLLSHTLSHILGDSSINDLPSISNTSTTEEGLKIIRSTSWLTATSVQVKLALEPILTRTRAHPKPTVRRAAANLCENLLSTCTKSLSASEGYALVVDTLIILSGDDQDPQLASQAGYTLQILAATNQKVGETLQQSLHGWILSLPRVMSGPDEDLKAKVVGRVSVGLKMLNTMGGGSDVLTDMIAQNIRDSLEATKAFSEVDKVGIEVVGEGSLLMLQSAGGTGGGGEASYPELILGHRTQKETITSLKKLLSTIGSTSSETVTTLASTYIRDARDGDPVSLWMALNLLRSSSLNEEVEWLNIDVNIGDFGDGLTQELFSVAHGILTDATSATAYLPQLDSPTSTLTTCLALESLSHIASTQKSHFKSELVDTLYPLIHLLGSPSPTIANHAIVTINNISLHCGYESPKEMILDNVDYLINALALKLNTFDISPQAPRVLGMVVKLTGKRVLPFLDDLVEGMVGALGAYHGYEKMCTGLVGVLGEIVAVGAEEEGDRNVGKIEGAQSEQKRKQRLSPKELVEKFREEERKRKRKKLGDSQPSPSEPTPHAPWGAPKSDKKFDPEAYLNGDMGLDNPPPQSSSTAVDLPPPEPSPTYKLLQKITKLTQRLLTHPSPALRIQLVNLIATSSEVLGSNEKEWLPVVNEIWPGLVRRLFDNEPGVVMSAARTVGRLAAGGAGEFISSRVNDAWAYGGGGDGRGSGVGGKEGEGMYELLKRVKTQVERERGIRPYSRPTLATSAVVSRRGEGSTRTHSSTQQIYTALLEMLASICRGCRLDEVVFDQMLETVGDELEAAIAGGKGEGEGRVRWELLKAMRRVNREGVWLEIRRRRWERGECVERDTVVEGVSFPGVVF